MSKAQDRGEGYWLGLDVSKESFDAAVAAEGTAPTAWSALKSERFAMSADGVEALMQWLEALRKSGICHGVCLESTGPYSQRLIVLLEQTDLPVVSMVNPARPVAFRNSFGLKHKTDRSDAALLALYGTMYRPRPIRRDSPAFTQLRMLWRLYEDFTGSIAAWNNRLEQALEKRERARIRRALACLKKEAEATWRDIEACVAQDETLSQDVAIASTIPGVGRYTAMVVMAEAGDLRQWKPRELSSYAGLYPVTCTSGASLNKAPRISGGGATRLRKALFFPAMSASRHHPRLRAWREDLLRRGKARKAAIIAIARKLLLLIRSVVLHQRPYDPEYKHRHHPTHQLSAATC